MSRDAEKARPAMKAPGGPATKRQILQFGTVALALLFVGPSRVAEPEQPTKVFRIVELNPTAGFGESQRAFRQALRGLGYVHGENILIEDRFAAGSEDRLREYAAEAVGLKVDVIVAISSSAVQAATNATKTLPIVAVDLESDPVAGGFVANLARPGGNVTGVFLDLPELNGKQLQLLKEAIPGITRVAVLWNPTVSPTPLRAAEGAARALGLQLQIVAAQRPSDFDSAFSAAVRGRNAALMVIPSPMFGGARSKLIGDLATKHRLPTTSMLSSYTDAGLLMSYGVNVANLFSQAAAYVDKILKGAKPGDLPVQRPVRFEMIVNLKIAKALGLTIPPSVLSRADRVVE
ncbi:MAG: ABC transporter substrate-binding protein [Thermoanaerobaculia bacterium]